MKLLLDENLSDRIVPHIKNLFPGSTHVKTLGLIHVPDTEIWEFAKTEGYVIVSKDWDFHQLSLLRGFPPKVIYLKAGNCPTDRITAILTNKISEIHAFCQDDRESLLIIGG